MYLPSEACAAKTHLCHTSPINPFFYWWDPSTNPFFSWYDNDKDIKRHIFATQDTTITFFIDLASFTQVGNLKSMFYILQTGHLNFELRHQTSL